MSADTAPQPAFNLRGQVALVTGASRGIGRAVAEQLAAGGASVAVHYHRQRDAAEAVRTALPGGPHGIFQADLAARGTAVDLEAAVRAELGEIGVLVNNAGIFELHKVAEVSFDAWCDAWQRTLAANLLGPAELTFVVAQRMIARGGGRIVNVTSRGAFRGEPDAPAYGASKAGLNAMSQSLAQALAPHGVMVFAVAPGWVETDMAAPYLQGPAGDAVRGQSPLRRAARPEEIARAVAFLAAEGTDYLTGCILDANGASYLRT